MVILSKGLGAGYVGDGAVLVSPKVTPLLRHKVLAAMPDKLRDWMISPGQSR
ncbi:hypothetical protein GCM10010347_65360 [Streptomyces cirratus]|uniref:Uncharacterized protein n=1 Tax=Streptomyces cirratus TaxID=68187 RepID=A0ABQ3F5H1_9ACTN|nr:hypothetical protein [Streptomyces cirratus]GHB85380.1 hypothetical protein GCM10010347_65360 [Streptomyces cirratus]